MMKKRMFNTCSAILFFFTGIVPILAQEKKDSIAITVTSIEDYPKINYKELGINNINANFSDSTFGGWESLPPLYVFKLNTGVDGINLVSLSCVDYTKLTFVNDINSLIGDSVSMDGEILVLDISKDPNGSFATLNAYKEYIKTEDNLGNFHVFGSGQTLYSNKVLDQDVQNLSLLFIRGCVNN